MGVYHFMGLGGDIGVITTAVDLFQKTRETIQQGAPVSKSLAKLFKNAGGINHQDEHGGIQTLVFFASQQDIENTLSFRDKKEQGGRGRTIKEHLKDELRALWEKKAQEIFIGLMFRSTTTRIAL